MTMNPSPYCLILREYINENRECYHAKVTRGVGSIAVCKG